MNEFETNINYDKYLSISNLEKREELFIKDIIDYIFFMKENVNEPINGKYLCDEWKFIITNIIPNNVTVLNNLITGNRFIFWDENFFVRNFKIIYNMRHSKRTHEKNKIIYSTGAGEKMDFIFDIIILHYNLFVYSDLLQHEEYKKTKWYHPLTRFFKENKEEKDIKEHGNNFLKRYNFLTKNTMKKIYYCYGIKF